jgi:hypothetical protein
MSTTVTYKGSTLTTVDNQTRTLKTAGKYMEGDVVLTDVSASVNVWQDENGYVHLDDEGNSNVSGLEYETGIFIPSEDTAEPTINFTSIHTTRPISIIITDIDSTMMPEYSNAVFMYTGIYDTFSTVPTTETAYYGRANYMRYASGTTLSTGGFSLTSLTGTTTSAVSYFVSNTAFKPYIGASYYWRAGRTYKWIAVWAPTT